MTSDKERDGVSKEASRPPRAPLAFRVGVIGHRPNKLPDKASQNALRSLIAHALTHISDAVQTCRIGPAAVLYADAPPQLSVVTSLAEGADRLVAEAGLERGYVLSCPLPFSREQFAQDFVAPHALEEHSLARFEALLATPGAQVFELDGVREAASAAYAYAGQVVLRQSDLLIAIWDGAPAAGGGGTAETLLAALKSRTPVLWLSPSTAPGWRVLRSPEDVGCLSWGQACTPPERGGDLVLDDAALRDDLFAIVKRELELPTFVPSAGEDGDALHDEENSAATYFNQGASSINLAIFWKLFRDALGSGSVKMPALRVRPFLDQIAPAWPTSPETTPPGRAWINQQLRLHYAWADKTADLNADVYRSGFVMSSLLAAGAVVAALAPVTIGSERWEAAATATELIFVFCIVLIMWRGSTRHWHERWLEYRVLAERIRALRLLTPLGGGRVVNHRPAHLAVYGDPDQSWMAWHARAIARTVGLPALRADPSYARECLADLRELCENQRSFHDANFKRAEKINEVLHFTTMTLFIITVAGVALHLGALLIAPSNTFIRQSIRLSIFAAGAFPAIGAALAAINNLGEFQRLAKRSHAMAANFAAAEVALNRVSAFSDIVRLRDLTPIAARIADSMVEEVSDWRIVFNDPAASSG